ncbi:hypothetical protein ZIOFF_074694 [Zingiber officinale]|uniref:RNase H type-1 domain-containing protein n=1 Tax=Zingiber officinale TaxID=94328 RepID=A0A8J5ELF1_ZINOF|nr:hypothetical protein ZIOFF_074694 [Zingiber officinale]
MIWKPAADGKFSLKSSWEKVRRGQESGGIWVAVWSSLLNPNVAVFMWRFLKSRLPVDELGKQGYILLGVRRQSCFGSRKGDREWSLGHAREVIPFLILWSLWRARNESKHHEDKRKPNWGFKLNLDGCAKGNPGISSYGAIVRDHEGMVVRAIHGVIGEGSNLRAELFGILNGLELCIANQYLPIWLESDSMVALKAIQSSCVGWELRNLINKIKGLIVKHHIRYSHVYREANAAADYLANQTFSFSMERVLSGHEVDRSVFAFKTAYENLNLDFSGSKSVTLQQIWHLTQHAFSAFWVYAALGGAVDNREKIQAFLWVMPSKNVEFIVFGIICLVCLMQIYYCLRTGYYNEAKIVAELSRAAHYFAPQEPITLVALPFNDQKCEGHLDEPDWSIQPAKQQDLKFLAWFTLEYYAQASAAMGGGEVSWRAQGSNDQQQQRNKMLAQLLTEILLKDVGVSLLLGPRGTGEEVSLSKYMMDQNG